MTVTNEILAHEIHSRFLYPFLFNRGREATAAAADSLRALRVPGRKGQLPVWWPVDQKADRAQNDPKALHTEGKSTEEQQEAEPKPASSEQLTTLYTDELLCPARAFLFPRTGESGCCYLRLNPEVAQHWFRNRVAVRHGEKVIFSAILDSPRMEVFLSPYGAGLLSIALCATPRQWSAKAGGVALDDVKNFNYRLAQLRRPSTVPTLGIPHPWDSPETKAKAPADIAPPPEPDAALTERLGLAGGSFNLGELVDLLLGPLTGTRGLAPTQEQFSVYTVVRFGSAVDFAQTHVREQLGPFLAGLAQIEEPAHAGAVPGMALDIPSHVMNTRQWVAVGSMGVAHLAADQNTPPEGFDEQRVSQYRDKYFIPCVLALLQRLTLQRSVEDAARAVHRREHEKRRDFRQLHGDLLDFTVAGHFTEVSSRHAVNGFYRLAQQGLGVDRSLGIVTRAVQSHEARQITDDLSANVRTVSQVQRKVEWLEIFFVSFYATELAHVISEHYFTHRYAAASVLTWPILAGLLAAWGLKPWRAHHETGKERWAVTAALLLTAVVGWLAIGFRFFPLGAGH